MRFEEGGNRQAPLWDGWERTSVGRFSNLDPVLRPVLIMRTGLRTNLRFSHEPELVGRTCSLYF